jgi:hypothetical protein
MVSIESPHVGHSSPFAMLPPVNEARRDAGRPQRAVACRRRKASSHGDRTTGPLPEEFVESPAWCSAPPTDKKPVAVLTGKDFDRWIGK